MTCVRMSTSVILNTQHQQLLQPSKCWSSRTCGAIKIDHGRISGVERLCESRIVFVSAWSRKHGTSFWCGCSIQHQQFGKWMFASWLWYSGCVENPLGGAVIERSAMLRLPLMNVCDRRGSGAGEGKKNPNKTSFTVFSTSSVLQLAQQRNCNQCVGAPPKVAACRCRWPRGCF